MPQENRDITGNVVVGKPDAGLPPEGRRRVLARGATNLFGLNARANQTPLSVEAMDQGIFAAVGERKRPRSK